MGGQNVIIRGRQDGDVADVSYGVLGVGPTEELAIQRGIFFAASIQGSGVAQGENLDLRISVPAGVFPQLSLGLSVTQATVAALYEGTTFTAPGTEQIPINLNRASANLADVEIFTAPTVDALGQRVVSQLIPSNQGGRAPGGWGNTKTKIILRESTEYLMRLTNAAATAAELGIEAYWYETDFEAQQLVAG